MLSCKWREDRLLRANARAKVRAEWEGLDVASLHSYVRETTQELGRGVRSTLISIDDDARRGRQNDVATLVPLCEAALAFAAAAGAASGSERGVLEQQTAASASVSLNAWGRGGEEVGACADAVTDSVALTDEVADSVAASVDPPPPAPVDPPPPMPRRRQRREPPATRKQLGMTLRPRASGKAKAKAKVTPPPARSPRTRRTPSKAARRTAPARGSCGRAFKVSAIRDCRLFEGHLQFLVKWAPPHHHPKNDTWEPLAGVRKLTALKAFKRTRRWRAFSRSK
jgi:hypothetical protein